MTHTDLLKRIDYSGDFLDLLHDVCTAYDIGKYALHSFIPIGYEDLNIVLSTTKGKFLLKVFGSFRTEESCHTYIKTMQKVIDADIPHPILYSSQKGLLYSTTHDGKTIRMCLMEYINGHTFFELKKRPNEWEQRIIIGIAAQMQTINYKPPFLYDSWAIPNILHEFEQTKSAMTQKDIEMVTPIANKFSQLTHTLLPHAFVHGDMISTNIIKDRSEKLYVIDFSVANWSPRIQELAVLLADVLFDAKSAANSVDLYYWALDVYQNHVPLTAEELKALPVYAQAAHAMHVIGASREKAHGNKEKENEYWLELGRKGVEFTMNVK